MRMRTLVALALALLTAMCGSPASPTDPGALKGGILATFSVTGQNFRVWIRNPATVEQVLAIQRGTSAESIPNGRLRVGRGQGGHNAPYSWHLDPDDVEMAGVTIEVCDGAPSYIEANRDAFIAQVGRYCPWGARLVAVEDYR